MNRSQISKVLECALTSLMHNEFDLFYLDVNERTLSYQLARYLTDLVPNGFSVDCEYNRHFDHVKRLDLPPRTALESECRATTVFPDIVVHKRNSDDNNLLVLELKKPGEDTDYDERKLLAFVKQFGYKHAAHVILGLARNGDIVREVKWVN
jgi:hypothetical protein